MLTIGKLAARTDLSTNALRFYEREGLVEPSSKSAAGYRLYADDAVARVKFIRQAQHCGFTLTEIHQLLTLRARDAACCDDVRRLAIEKKLQLEAKIRSMKVMSRVQGARPADRRMPGWAAAGGGVPDPRCPGKGWRAEQGMKVELFHAVGCRSCAAARDTLKAVAQRAVPGVVWREVDAAGELDYLLEVGVLSLPALAVDGQLVFSSLPTPAQLADELQRRAGGAALGR